MNNKSNIEIFIELISPLISDDLEDEEISYDDISAMQSERDNIENKLNTMWDLVVGVEDKPTLNQLRKARRLMILAELVFNEGLGLMKEGLIKSIKLNQDEGRLKILYQAALKDEPQLADYMFSNLVNEIKVGDGYCCYELRDNAIIGNHNIYVTEINKMERDYEIKGIDLEDKELILKFSDTELWYQ